ncbi:MAG: carbon-nitrogen hydrolase family protein [Anaerocolumna sp.]|jgi:predicted amidohydrolase|nr:carbon-nitrogen hydrolase family protein [Anaerocolumna sp.]
MRLALVQMKMNNDSETNLHTALSAMEEAAANKADMILFPELQFTPFFPQYQGLNMEQQALEINHPFLIELRNKSRELGLFISPNFYLKEKGCNYDASLMIDNSGELLGISKMVHITQSEGFYEQEYYTPSDDGFKVYNTPYGKVGIVICFDRHLPESIRTCAALGAELILIPTANTIGEPMELFEWEVRVQAMQSSVFIAMCNRVGEEDNMNFAGQSLVADPIGNTLIKAGDAEEILYCDIDLKQSSIIRNEKPYFRLRRTEFYL